MIDLDAMLTLAISSNEEIEWTWKGDISAIRFGLFLEILNVGMCNCRLCWHSFSWWASIRDNEVFLAFRKAITCGCHTLFVTIISTASCFGHWNSLAAAIEQCHHVAAVHLCNTAQHLLHRIAFLFIELHLQVLV